jgi:hypothetical protein
MNRLDGGVKRIYSLGDKIENGLDANFSERASLGKRRR